MAWWMGCSWTRSVLCVLRAVKVRMGGSSSVPDLFDGSRRKWPPDRLAKSCTRPISKKTAPQGAVFAFSMEIDQALAFLRRRMATAPASPVPNSESVKGSGTAVGSTSTLSRSYQDGTSRPLNESVVLDDVAMEVKENSV